MCREDGGKPQANLFGRHIGGNAIAAPNMALWSAASSALNLRVLSVSATRKSALRCALALRKLSSDANSAIKPTGKSASVMIDRILMLVESRSKRLISDSKVRTAVRAISEACSASRAFRQEFLH
jgi:hypothetical protein